MKKSTTPSEFLSVGEVSARSGVAISALHFYETKGLIEAIRNKQNQRRYPRGVLRIISLIKVAQKLGFSLEEILDMFKVLPQGERPTEKDWEKLSKGWRVALDAKIKTMERLRDQLERCIGCGCLSLKDCPLRNNNDKLAKKGAGAHLL
jgi:MerR family redox-sensitive transcriptional activator SoxR